MANYLKQLLLSVFLLTGLLANGQQHYLVEAQRFDPHLLMRPFDNLNSRYSSATEPCIIIVPAFEISKMVTFGEYKQYLTEVRKNSSLAFYLAQLPDCSILSPRNYARYISDTSFNAYPVAGIRWEAAMNYCRWKSIRDNSVDSIAFLYRMPRKREWHAALNYLTEKGLKHDFNQDYSDWLCALYYEGGSVGLDSCRTYNDVLYLFKPADPIRMKRMCILGNNYYFQGIPGTRGYYSFEGYKHIGFRLVKVPKQTTRDYEELAKRFGLDQSKTTNHE